MIDSRIKFSAITFSQVYACAMLYCGSWETKAGIDETEKTPLLRPCEFIVLPASLKLVLACLDLVDKLLETFCECVPA